MTTGIIGGVVAAGAALHGPYEVTVTASDGTLSTTRSFGWAVRPAEAPAGPEVGDPGPQASQPGDEVALPDVPVAGQPQPADGLGGPGPGGGG